MKGIESTSSPTASNNDPAFRRLMMFLLIGTRGGVNRSMILRLLRDEPLNANRIAERLKLDYKTVQHHLALLEQHNVIAPSPKGTYGAVYFLTPLMERNLHLLGEKWVESG